MSAITIKYEKLKLAVELINKYNKVTPLDADAIYTSLSLESMYENLVREYEAKNVTPKMIAIKYMGSFGIKNDLTE